MLRHIVNGLIVRIKVNSMSHEIFKKQIYASILELLNDPKMYYYSTVGPTYCKLTEEGKVALLEYVEIMAPYMVAKEKKHLQDMAKDLTWKELKK